MLKKNEQAFKKNNVLGLSFHGFHRINYFEWGADDTSKDTIVCVHGVSRNGRDFDYLARQLSDEYRLICPDVVGRGESDHLVDKDSYDYLQYNADMNVLLSRLNVPFVDWIGTSMGGIIGMVLASLPQSPIRRLVLNDVGPWISRDALNAIGDYLGRAGEFNTPGEVERYLREAYSEFHPMTDEDWREITDNSMIRTRKGKYRLRMDEGIGDSFRDRISLFDVDMWDTWDRIDCPVLILRGKESSFFSEQVAQEMLSRGPKASLIEFDGAGHTPTLRNDEQVGAIQKWLAETDYPRRFKEMG